MLISEHQVRECAYYIWENEGRIHGHAAAHWIRAEAELRANAMLAAGVASKTVEAPKATKAAAAKTASAKPAAAKPATTKSASAKPTAAKPTAAKPAAVKAAAKPVAPKTVRASKAAVTAGLAAKAKPARTAASMH
ncbi:MULTISPECIES: DUF2934 domain-containing protein [Methylobacterium]|jgi:hypothetical protein|uniref:Methyl-accepting chemotaxis sensory transducer n=2 Tax=Methylobacterium TaxID=407 RepID=A0A089NMG9_9HYPH|nr:MULTISPECIES: DUF2934 domain-containing protein [Methylobacterium]AIQ88567.1 methyl-accepting chemotaxis sensory transducer [Methylobacterium oryzae CBMB20]AWV18860.1 hypothetical protein A3862_27690 [Methylobacterium sp. XJLW]MBA9062864.1 topoisomerase IA-like protein [Methylobacterium fujisawaense]MBP32907.1 DUF2934 domain-containing protein [Methylobacterium sp.]WFS08591.1 DUF2934 domain-containing protein [Methylobacterium sp. 391_Methyba4]